jgi:hypothetical protein
MNRLNQNVMVVREFPDTNPPIILHFGPDICDGSLHVQGSLIHRRRQQFRLLRQLKIAYMCFLNKALSWYTFLTIS